MTDLTEILCTSSLNDVVGSLIERPTGLYHIEKRADFISGAGRSLYVVTSGSERFLLKVSQSKIPNNPSLHQHFESLPTGAYQVPKLLGTREIEKLHIELWEYIEGNSLVFSGMRKETLSSFLKAMAASDALGRGTAELKESYWIRPISSKLRKTSDPKLSQFASHFRQIAYWERKIIDKMMALEYACVTHNDLHSYNVINSDGTFYLIDWESASFGPPGSSLRVFTEHRLGTWVAAKYARAFSDQVAS